MPPDGTRCLWGCYADRYVQPYFSSSEAGAGQKVSIEHEGEHEGTCGDVEGLELVANKFTAVQPALRAIPIPGLNAYRLITPQVRTGVAASTSLVRPLLQPSS
jgi:hypothetical protein